MEKVGEEACGSLTAANAMDSTSPSATTFWQVSFLI
jgi:hypothetical protein